MQRNKYVREGKRESSLWLIDPLTKDSFNERDWNFYSLLNVKRVRGQTKVTFEVCELFLNECFQFSPQLNKSTTVDMSIAFVMIGK